MKVGQMMNWFDKTGAALLLAVILTASLSPMAVAEVRESEVLLTVPADGNLNRIELYLDAPGNLAREEQVLEESDSLLSIGRVKQTVVDFSEGEKMVKGRAVVDQPVLFYLYSPTSQVESFEIRIVSAASADGFKTSGVTPSTFVVEALELPSVGTARGRSLKRFDDVSFRIGELNRFPLGLEINPDKTFGVRIWARSGEWDEMSVQIKASHKGRYPAHVLRRDSEGQLEASSGQFHPDVAFSYRGVPSGGKFLVGNPLERLAEQINNFVRGQSGRGGTIQVPLKVRLHVAP